MAKSYDDFEAMLCKKVVKACQDLEAGNLSKNEKISRICEINETASILKEWLEIPSQESDHHDDSTDDYDQEYSESSTKKSSKEVY